MIVLTASASSQGKHEGLSVNGPTLDHFRRRFLPLFHWSLHERRLAAKETMALFRRRLRPAEWALPHFIIIGAQKAGTSSFYTYLARHPQVQRALRKEVHYFDLNYRRGEAWYRAHFPPVAALAPSDQITGEASPYYMAHPHALNRIMRDLPEVKLIALLRNPVERTISHYFHEKRHGTEPLSLIDAVMAEDRLTENEWTRMSKDQSYNSVWQRRYSYIFRSNYINQLRQVLPLRTENRLLLLKAEDLFEKPAETMARSYEFLGLEPFTEPQAYPAFNKGRTSRVSNQDRAVLADLLQPAVLELERETGIGWNLGD